MPTRRRLLRLFAYDPATGDLIWRERPASDFVSAGEAKRWNGRYAGKVAGSQGDFGCLVTIDGVSYKAHRIIWRLLNHGLVPDIIDHRDLDRLNNRPDNIRPATHSQNEANRKLRRNNTSGYKGVYKHGNKFGVKIRYNRSVRFLGYFDTAEAASEVYQTEAVRLHGEFARYE
jgi:hypothetical protein